MNGAFRASINLNFHWGNEGLRYTFNGKETDPESDLQDYGMRIYNARLGKFLSVDPLSAGYPFYSPYHFAGNMPISCIDLDGGEPKAAYGAWSQTKGYKNKGYYHAETPNTCYEKVEGFWVSTYHHPEGGMTMSYWDGSHYIPFLEIAMTPPPPVEEPAPGTGLGEFGRIMHDGYGPGMAGFADAMETGIIAGAAIGLTGGLALTPGGMTILTYGLRGSLTTRAVSSGVDYTSQVLGNYAFTGDWGKSFSNVNYTSVLVSGIAPGGGFKGFGSYTLLGLRNTAVSSAFEVTNNGYYGLGSKPIGTYALQVGMGGLGNGIGGGLGNWMGATGNSLYRSTFANASYRLGQGSVTNFGLTGSRMMGGFMMGASHLQMGEILGQAGGNAGPNLLQKPR